MFRRSISSGSTTPRPTASAAARIAAAAVSRAGSGNIFESAMPRSAGASAANTTAAATTGPASGPMPTSSMPATRCRPALQSRRSTYGTVSYARSLAFRFTATPHFPGPAGRMRPAGCQGEAVDPTRAWALPEGPFTEPPKREQQDRARCEHDEATPLRTALHQCDERIREHDHDELPRLDAEVEREQRRHQPF